MTKPTEKSSAFAAPGDELDRHNDSYPAIDSSKSDLSGKNVFIVGGTKGIGRSIVLSYAKAGAAAIGVAGRSEPSTLTDDINEAAKSAGKAPPKVLMTKLDVKDPKSVDAALRDIEKNMSKLDILVFNSGSLSISPIVESDPDIWWNDFETNARGPYLVTRAFLPLMMKSGMGQMVFVSSTGAFMKSPTLSSYQTSKMAALRYAEFIDAEYAEKGILAFSIHPGGVAGTDIIPGGTPEMLKPLLTESPELCADTIVYLTQEKRQWLGGRYISCKWDMPELLAKKDEIVKGNKLKMILNL